MPLPAKVSSAPYVPPEEKISKRHAVCCRLPEKNKTDKTYLKEDEPTAQPRKMKICFIHEE
jgi:hypothetical protein